MSFYQQQPFNTSGNPYPHSQQPQGYGAPQGESQSYFGSSDLPDGTPYTQYPPTSQPPGYPLVTGSGAPYGVTQPPYGQEYPASQRYTSGAIYGTEPARSQFEQPYGAGQIGGPVGPEGDRGAMGALAGGALGGGLGGAAGHKMGNHGILGGIGGGLGGAVAGSLLEDQFKKHNNGKHHGRRNSGSGSDSDSHKRRHRHRHHRR